MKTALIIVLSCALSSSAVAGTMGGHSNSDANAYACDNVLRDASHLVTLADADPNADMPKALKTLHDDEGLCPYPNRINVGDGYAAFAQASALHRAADPAWQATLDTAIAKLTRCQTDYPKGKIGTDCAAAVNAATNHKTEWSTATPKSTSSP